jgi:hypothetical protein
VATEVAHANPVKTLTGGVFFSGKTRVTDHPEQDSNDSAKRLGFRLWTAKVTQIVSGDRSEIVGISPDCPINGYFNSGTQIKIYTAIF